MKADQINILGAGLVGTLLSVFLSKRGFPVHVFEKRSDPRTTDLTQGKSINLALSHRGIRALQAAGVYEAIQSELIPMKGRMMHDLKGNRSIQLYGSAGQVINSVSRLGLNKGLISASEHAGTAFHFDHYCKKVDIESTTAFFDNREKEVVSQSNVLIGADGAYSVLRRTLEATDRFDFQQHYIAHGYKEFRIPPVNGEFALEPNYLHIWPRGNFMLIALPNPDKSFTCTLFFPFEGELSFSSLTSGEVISDLFETYFPDVLPIMPDYLDQYLSGPTSSLVTIKAYPWHRKNCLLIGDACHAIVPFYGQGMNAGFEDCRLFMEWGMRFGFDWAKLFPYFSTMRKADADAIADLAMSNFVEMRDKVADRHFLNIKRLEARLHANYPDTWLPLYSMVTFSDLPYSKALETGKMQEKILNQLPRDFDPDQLELEPIISRLNAAMKAGQ